MVIAFLVVRLPAPQGIPAPQGMQSPYPHHKECNHHTRATRNAPYPPWCVHVWLGSQACEVQADRPQPVLPVGLGRLPHGAHPAHSAHQQRAARLGLGGVASQLLAFSSTRCSDHPPPSPRPQAVTLALTNTALSLLPIVMQQCFRAALPVAVTVLEKLYLGKSHTNLVYALLVRYPR